MESVLPSIIHFNQCAYVKGRTIFDAVRTIDDILDYTEKSKINGRMIAIDFEKVVVSVSREFLFRTLSAFCFGPSFTQWIHTFYKNISGCVLNNGFSTAPFEIQRDVRQGDPLSPYLFIITLEILAIATRRNKDIQGIIVDEEEIKLGLFAYDLTAFLRNDKSLTVFLDLVQNFGKCSGLIINHEKSEIIFLGNATSLLPNHTMFKGTKIKKSVKLLGVHFTYDYRLKRKLNFDELIKSI